MPKRFRPEEHLENPGDTPSYIKDLPPPTDAEFWRRIEWQFTSALECLGMQAIQTEEEAAGRFVRSSDGLKNQWTSGGVHYAALPLINGMDSEYLAQQFNTIKTLCGEIRADIKARRLTPEFLWRWGLLNNAVGAIEAYSFLEPHADGHVRAALSRNRSDEENRKSWYARQIIRIQILSKRRRHKTLPRTGADRVFARLVHGIAYGNLEDVSECNRAIVENDQVREWCKTYVNRHLHEPHDWGDAVKTTYTNISATALRQIRKASVPGLPDLELEFPQV